ncbi:hypothetical protein BCV23_25435 [Vibrio lentus]|uniref:Glycosyltransferase family 2 protein n=1 Tax=Vibrio lentus TaxID=136468 RepID=A0AA44VYI8_9VIBR|nr:hypothetical protein BCV23_25435 [Vibrio lentus]
MKIIIRKYQSIVNKSNVIKEPTLIMTILAKDEVDVIEQQLIFHKRMGVDSFVVTDNGSSDGTLEVFEKYQKKGWIKEIILEPSKDYYQTEWVDNMIRIARDKYKADWIINSDADEFWLSKSGNLKNELRQSTANSLAVKIYNVYPGENSDKKYLDNTYLIKKQINTERYNLSQFSIYNRQIEKVIHRSLGYVAIRMGNHSVDMKKKNQHESKDIEIFHFCLRGYEHFIRKMTNGGESVERAVRLKKDVAVHWRYYYELLQDKNTDPIIEYNRVIGTKYFNDFVRDGVLVKDESVRNVLEGSDAE